MNVILTAVLTVILSEAKNLHFTIMPRQLQALRSAQGDRAGGPALRYGRVNAPSPHPRRLSPRRGVQRQGEGLVRRG